MSDMTGNAESTKIWPRPDFTQYGGGSAVRGGPAPSAAEDAFASAPAACSRCAAQLVPNAAFCQRCGQRATGAPAPATSSAAPGPVSGVRRPAAGPRPAQFVVVTGRAQVAGWLVLGGGAALLLSAFLPWFSFLGFVGAHLPAAYFLAFGFVGGLLAYFGFRGLKGQVTRAIMATLWVLAAIAAFVAVGLFVAAQDLGNQTYGTVSPSSGFYIGFLGLVATVAGTILLQTTRRASS